VSIGSEADNKKIVVFRMGGAGNVPLALLCAEALTGFTRASAT
jgi:hypothetical protein